LVPGLAAAFSVLRQCLPNLAQSIESLDGTVHFRKEDVDYIRAIVAIHRVDNADFTSL